MMDSVDHIMQIMECSFEPQWREAWNRNQVLSSLLTPSTIHQFVYDGGAGDEKQGRICGFNLLKFTPGEVELLLIAVKPEFRGQGFAKKLLNMAVDEARAHNCEYIFLEVRENNPSLILYKNFGFIPIGKREGYYTTNEGIKINAITMRLTL